MTGRLQPMVSTPARIENPPGLSEIAYRVGTHGRFKATMLARLSSEARAALQGLGTRSDDDFSVALMDAWATVADVLSFYQERIANESYLLTAEERLSLLHLTRLIGYRPAPGRAASTYLAFTLDNAPGAPSKVEIPVGTQAQSLPTESNALPQTYETVETFTGYPAWNELRPRKTRIQQIGKGTVELYLELGGAAAQLRTGDMLLFVDEHVDNGGWDGWESHRIAQVDPDRETGRTRITLATPLESATSHWKLYAFRQRADVFGYNAPDWKGLPDAAKATYLGIDDPTELTDWERREWPHFVISAPELEGLYDQTSPTRPATPEAVAAAAKAAAESILEANNIAALMAVPDAAVKVLNAVVVTIQTLASSLTATASAITDQLEDPAAIQADGADAITALLQWSHEFLTFLLNAIKFNRGLVSFPNPDTPDDELTGSFDEIRGILKSIEDIINAAALLPAVGFDSPGEKFLQTLLFDLQTKIDDFTRAIPNPAKLADLLDPSHASHEGFQNLLAKLLTEVLPKLPFVSPLIKLFETDFASIGTTVETASTAVSNIPSSMAEALGANLASKAVCAAVDLSLNVPTAMDATFGPGFEKFFRTPEAVGFSAIIAAKMTTEIFRVFDHLDSDALSTVIDVSTNDLGEFVSLPDGFNLPIGYRLPDGFTWPPDFDWPPSSSNTPDFHAYLDFFLRVKDFLGRKIIDSFKKSGDISARLTQDLGWFADDTDDCLNSLAQSLLGSEELHLTDEQKAILLNAGISASASSVAMTLGIVALMILTHGPLPYIVGPFVPPLLLLQLLFGRSVANGAKEVETTVVNAVCKVIESGEALSIRRALPQSASDKIDLDTRYPSITPKSYLLLSRPSKESDDGIDDPSQSVDLDSSDIRCLYRVNSAAELSRSDFSVNAKCTRIGLDITEEENDQKRCQALFHLKSSGKRDPFHTQGFFDKSGNDYLLQDPEHPFLREVRNTSVYAQSEELRLAESPNLMPVPVPERLRVDDGLELMTIVLDRDLALKFKPMQRIALTGIDITSAVSVPAERVGEVVEVQDSYSIDVDSNFALTKHPKNGTATLAMDGSFTYKPNPSFNGTDSFEFRVMDSQGAAQTEQVTIGIGPNADALVHTYTTGKNTPVSDTLGVNERFTKLILRRAAGSEGLQRRYRRGSARLYANLILATHGETQEEVLGSGDAGKAFQSFPLTATGPGSALTHVPSEAGIDSTLEVRVNGIRWDQVRGRHELVPGEHLYVTRTDDNDNTMVVFGDGEQGARLPTGQENVAARYRTGSGSEGDVPADQISLLTKRPVGVLSVSNPVPARGGSERERLDAIRANSPASVLALDRVVSLQDYADYATGDRFPDIVKGLAVATRDGMRQGVHLTVAGFGGAVPDQTCLDELAAALRAAGDPHVLLRVESYEPVKLDLSAKVQIEESFRTEDVRNDLESQLTKRFSFNVMRLGQGVARGEIVALMQGVPGVLAVDVDKPSAADPFLGARVSPAGVAHAAAQPAQLFLLAEDRLVLEVVY